MRVGELFHLEVLGDGGERLGKVVDVRLVQDGPRLQGLDHTFRVDGIVIGRRAWPARLGLFRPEARHPRIVTAVARLLTGHHVYADWSQVEDIADHVRITGRPGEIPPSPPHGPTTSRER